MHRISLLFLFSTLASAACIAQNYHCPQAMICSGIKVITCQPGEWSDSWEPHLEGKSNFLSPYFTNYAARFDPIPKTDYCFYRNANRDSIYTTHLGNPIYPIFNPATAWKWADSIHSNAVCVQTGNPCPFTDNPNITKTQKER